MMDPTNKKKIITPVKSTVKVKEKKPIDKDLEGVRKSYPNMKVSRFKKSLNRYSLQDKNGHSVTLNRGVSKTKRYTTKEAVAKTFNKK
jgi:hypothetical protein